MAFDSTCLHLHIFWNGSPLCLSIYVYVCAFIFPLVSSLFSRRVDLLTQFRTSFCLVLRLLLCFCFSSKGKDEKNICFTACVWVLCEMCGELCFFPGLRQLSPATLQFSTPVADEPSHSRHTHKKRKFVPVQKRTRIFSFLFIERRKKTFRSVCTDSIFLFDWYFFLSLQPHKQSQSLFPVNWENFFFLFFIQQKICNSSFRIQSPFFLFLKKNSGETKNVIFDNKSAKIPFSQVFWSSLSKKNYILCTHVHTCVPTSQQNGRIF